ncbi:MAG: glycosyltransferase family 2 protein [Patescibacteria group bacterium]|nr:glycosyltransferase family 2 protein [Patescibacteria group bacterium]
MLLSIIILNYKTANLAKHCLKNILALNLNFPYEIIVVDNNSHDKMEQILKERFGAELHNGQIKFLPLRHNRGMGAGNNAGATIAAGQYLLILNPDVVVTENSIENLVDFLEKNEKVGIVAPKFFYPNKNYQPSRYRFPKIYIPAFVRTGLGDLKFGKEKIKKYFMEDVVLEGPHQIDWVRGAAMLIRKNNFQEIGGFDERFFMYLEDTDLCRRFWQKGFEVWYLPEAEMIHYYARTSQKNKWFLDIFTENTFIHIISWFKYFWKWRNFQPPFYKGGAKIAAAKEF